MLTHHSILCLNNFRYSLFCHGDGLLVFCIYGFVLHKTSALVPILNLID